MTRLFGVLFEGAHWLQFEPGVRAALQRSMARVADAIADMLQRGQTLGSIRNDVPSVSLAWLVVSLIQARQFRRTFTPEPSKVLEDDLLIHILDAFGRKRTATKRHVRY